MNKLNLTAIALIILVATASQVMAQNGKSKRPSPPAQVSASVDGTTVTVDYSRPSVKGRTIFGDLVPFSKVWRTGANESSWIEVSSDVKIEGQKLAKGKYGLFTIPGKDEWTIIFNSVSNKWGAYSYDDSKDVLRVKVKPESADFTEQFTVSADDNGAVTLSWEKTLVTFNISK
ncbi:MAG: DUF2911 domain-containing protein [Cyclobacteriaceae bacterium]|nr:DUF2911 domain-containing protein [Cyclobacteriaceae bacterium HetDA_MAG_MS6]